MAAAIRKGAQFARLVAQQDERPTYRIDRAVIARHWQFAGKADEEPVAQMDVLHLRMKHGGRGVHTARQCVCG